MLLRIRELRKARGLTVEQLADAAGMSKGYLSEIENGKKQINARRMEALAAILHVGTAELIADPTVSQDLALHLEVVRKLPPEDQAAIQRHALSLLRARETE